MSIVLVGSTSGSVTLQEPAVAGTTTINLPAATGTMALLQTPSFATTIGVGNATPSTSGAGITFPATQSASSDANTLDDYEEGTWTASYYSGANGTGSLVATGSANRYTKIGRQVYISFNRGANGSGNALSITGLPFSVFEPASSITADAVCIFSDGGAVINYRGSGEGLYSRGCITYIVT